MLRGQEDCRWEITRIVRIGYEENNGEKQHQDPENNERAADQGVWPHENAEAGFDCGQEAPSGARNDPKGGTGCGMDGTRSIRRAYKKVGK